MNRFNNHVRMVRALGTPVLAVIIIVFSCSISSGTEKVRTLNGHYFEYRGKPVVLIGDSATQSVMQNLNVDYRAWLDELAEKGIRAAMIWAWMAVSQDVEGSAVDRRYKYVVPEVTPWVRSGTGTANDGKSLWDLNTFDHRYWKRLKDVVSYAESKDIIMLITVFDGWPKRFWAHPFNKKNGGPVPEPDKTTFKQSVRQWMKYMLDGENNIDAREEFWTLYHYDQEVLDRNYDDSWPWQLKNQYYQERFAAEIIAATSGYSNVMYELVNEGSRNKKYDQHWIDFFAKRCDNVIIINDDFTPLDGRQNPRVDAISWHTQKRDSIYDINRRWVSGFRDNPPKPVINSETVPAYYDGSPSADAFRKIVWSTVTAGGNIFVQDDTGFAFDPLAPQKPKGKLLRNYLGYANSFINRPDVEITRMEPLGNIIKSGRGFVLGLIDTEYIIYIPEKNTVTVDLTASSGFYECKWFDPSAGVFSDPFTVRGGTGTAFSPPFSDDSVLHIKNRGNDREDRPI